MAASQYDLTTLLVCKTWVNSTSGLTTDDVQLQLLLTAASRQIVREVGYSPFISTISEVRDGNGNNRIFVRNGPIVAVKSLIIRGGFNAGFDFSTNLTPTTIQPSDGASAGYIFDDNIITLVGYHFPIGSSNIIINYSFGQNDSIFESVTLPSTTYTVVNAATFAGDLGVVYGDGTPLTKVKTLPLQSQYAAADGFIQTPKVINGGVYTFNAADVGRSVYIQYRFGVIPEDWQQIAAEAVGLLYANKKHIGLTKSVLGGQTSQFLDGPLPPETLRKLNLITRKIPVV